MKTLATLALLAATATVAMAEDAKIKLEYKFADGDVIRSKVVHLSTVETKIKGSTQTAQSRSFSTKNWKVEGLGETVRIQLCLAPAPNSQLAEPPRRSKVSTSSLRGLVTE